MGVECERRDQAIAGRGSGANHAGAGFGHGAGGGKMAGRLIMAFVWTCRTSFAGEDGGGCGVLTEIFDRVECRTRGALRSFGHERGHAHAGRGRVGPADLGEVELEVLGAPRVHLADEGGLVERD